MPAIAAFATVLAAATGATAWLAHADRDSPRVTLWDYAGASTLIAVAASMFSRPHQVTQLFGVAIAP
jgi:hypothetical protein